MDLAMASATERNEVLGHVVSEQASRADMMDVQII